METIEEVNRRFNEELERYEKKEMTTNDIFHIGKPIGVLTSFLPDLPIVMRPRIVNKGTKKKHDVEISALTDMPQYLANPIFIFQRDKDTLGILTEMSDRSGRNVCVAIELNKTIQEGKAFIEVNDVRSIHGRRIENIVYPILQNGTLCWVDKEKGLAWLSSASPNVQQEIDKQDLISATKIVQNFQNPPLKNQKTMETIEQERKQYISHSLDGSLYSIEEKRNGKQDGLYRRYYVNGRISSEWNYKDGVPHGLNREWKPDGTLQYVRNFKDGQLDGVCRRYFDNGRIFKEENYKDGKLEGLTRVWHPDGRFNYDLHYHNGEAVSRPEPEMERKYEFTGETLQHEGYTLHRIRAVDDLPGDDMHDISPVTKGELGGWIEKEENLSHRGFCWVGGDAKVWGNAQVHDNAQVRGHAEVSQGVIVENTAIIEDKAKISGNAQVFGNSYVGDEAKVSNNAMIGERACIGWQAHITDGAYVSGAAIVLDEAIVKDKATIDGETVIGEKAEVSGNAIVAGMARIEGNALVSEEAKVLDDAEIYGKARVMGYARVEGANVGLIGPSGGYEVLSGTTCLKTKKEFHETGEISKIVTYLDGKMEGKCMTCYPNGNTKEIITYKNGVKEGLYEAWHENREMKERAYYKDDLRHGLYESWNEDGKRTARCVFKNGEEVRNPIQRLFKPKERSLGL